LKDEEFLFDLVPTGSALYGVHDELTLGLSSTLLIFGLPNVFLKHKMFHLGIMETSFTSFTAYLPKREVSDAKISGLITLNGIVSSFEFTNTFSLNLGVFGAYALLNITEEERDFGDIKSGSELSFFAAELGFDYYFSSRWALSSFVLIPFYFSSTLQTDFGERIGTSFFNPNLVENYLFGKFVMTRSWDVLSFEFGLVQFGQNTGPFISLIWRVQ